MTETPKWKDGTYRMSSLNHVLFKVVGESCKAEPLSGTMDDSFSLGAWKYGDFGEAHPDVANIFLQMMDEGTLTGSNAKTVDVKN